MKAEAPPTVFGFVGGGPQDGRWRAYPPPQEGGGRSVPPRLCLFIDIQLNLVYEY